MKTLFIALTSIVLTCCSAQALLAQEKTDPASDTNIIKETLDKIRNVDNLEKYIAENTTLKGENKTLKEQIASLSKQVTKLTEELKTENERLRKQLLQLPTFDVKSKLVSAGSAMAVLQFGEKPIRIRQGVEMSVPASGGIWTLMKVNKISKELIELEFPELQRTIMLYD